MKRFLKIQLASWGTLGIDPNPSKKEPHVVKMFIGGFTGMLSITAAHPLDVLKVRLQISRANWRNREMIKLIYQREGYKALYLGLSAALLRQATVTTTRFGVFNVMYSNYIAKHGNKPEIREKVGIGVLAGIVSSFIGAPCDVALVKMLTESTPLCSYGILKHCKARGLCTPPKYNGIFRTLQIICREEGYTGLFRGANLTVTRSIIVSVSQIGTYSTVEELLKKYKLRSQLNQHICCGMASSLVAAVFSMPVDIVKTRYLMPKKYPYSAKTILRNIVVVEGVASLYKGFIPYYMRMLYTTIVSGILVNKFGDYYHRWKFPAR